MRLVKVSREALTLTRERRGRGFCYRDENGDNAGGITNRPLDEEIDNQAEVPGRGQSKADTRGKDSE